VYIVNKQRDFIEVLIILEGLDYFRIQGLEDEGTVYAIKAHLFIYET